MNNAMPQYTLSDLARMLRIQNVKARVHGEARIQSFSFSSKAVSTDTLFLALPGQKEDGHLYIEEALKKGAAAVLVSRGKAPQHAASIEVEDTHFALKALAIARCQECAHTRKIALTGSNGKTTTKELLYAMLSQLNTGYRSPKNYNTLTGIAISCMALQPSHEFAVFEFGMDHVGEIAELAHIFFPSIGLITNIGHAHIGNIGELRLIIEEKKQIFLSLPSHGTAIAPGNSRFLPMLSSKLPCPLKKHGVGHTPGFIRSVSDGIRGSRLVFQEGEIRLPLIGIHNVENALAAIRVAQVCGLPFSAIQKGIEHFRPVSGRLSIMKGYCTVLDDTYNASPESMEGAFSALEEIRKDFSRSFVILGGMEELGEYSASFHTKIIEQLADLHFDGGILFGSAYADIDISFLSNLGFANSFAEIFLFIRAHVGKDDVVLIKGSRVHGLEYIVQVLLNGSMDDVA